MTSEGFNRGPFRAVRFDIRDFISIPVQAWLAFGKARKTTEAYRALLEIPMDLASAGFDVSVRHDDLGWHIDLSKELGDNIVLEMNGAARSYAAALFQIAQMADVAISDLERTARRTWEREQDSEAAA